MRGGRKLPYHAASAEGAVLGEMCAALAWVYSSVAAEKNTARLLERARLGSTGIGEGVAIPHGKLSGLPGLLAAFARKKSGVDFAAIDAKPTYLFFVLFAPDNSAGLHLKALARISRLFKQPQFRQGILAANDGAAIFRLISEEDAKY